MCVFVGMIYTCMVSWMFISPLFGPDIYLMGLFNLEHLYMLTILCWTHSYVRDRRLGMKLIDVHIDSQDNHYSDLQLVRLYIMFGNMPLFDRLFI